jgi:4-hydroxybenzoate polyprenyltransferase
MLPLLEALRPYQWVKNLLVFAPLVFAKRMLDPGAAWHAVLAFVAFCAVASGIYLLNDLKDVEGDRAHPEKKRRPLPSGRLRPGTAWLACGALVLAGLALAYTGVRPFHWPVAAYLVINVLYSFRLKHVVVLDTMCVASGFLLRVFTGGEAIGEPVSGWLTLCIFFVALLLAFCKRRHELVLLGEGSMEHRRSLDDYSLPFLDQLIAPLGALTVMTYAAYTVSHEAIEQFGGSSKEGSNLVYTVPFVVFGIFRYLYLVHIKVEGGNPTRLLLKDPPTLVNILLWFGVCVWVVYLRHS